MNCSVPDCPKPSRAKGLCDSHYKRSTRHGDPVAGRKPNEAPVGIRLPWTDERRAQVLKMWDSGDSAATIAARIGTGVTRNSVIGIVHRRKDTSFNLIPRRVPREPRIRVQSEAPIPRPTTRRDTPSLAPIVRGKSVARPRAVRPEPSPIDPSRQPCSILNLAGDGCKFAVTPHGGGITVRSHRFCNQPRDPRVPYCDAHLRFVTGARPA